jgi:hypothetical protein
VAFAASGAAALALSTGLVWHTAYATFADSTAPMTPRVTTGTIVLADDDAGTAMFTLSGWEPGAAATRCISVTSSGSAPGVVRFYGTGRSTSRSLTSYLNLTALSGTGGGSGNCAGFVADSTVYTGTVAGLPTTYGTGAGSWTTAGNTAGETRTYQLTLSVAAGAPSSAQGGTASVAFTWEVQPA